MKSGKIWDVKKVVPCTNMPIVVSNYWPVSNHEPWPSEIGTFFLAHADEQIWSFGNKCLRLEQLEHAYIIMGQYSPHLCFVFAPFLVSSSFALCIWIWDLLWKSDPDIPLYGCGQSCPCICVHSVASPRHATPRLGFWFHFVSVSVDKMDGCSSALS